MLCKWAVRPHVYLLPWLYNRVEEEDNNDSAVTAMQVSRHVYLSPWVYNRVEEEDNNDSAITAIQVSSKSTCIPFTLGV